MSNLSASELSQIKIIEEEVNEYLQSKQTNPKSATGINSALNRVIPRALMPTKKITIIWNDKARKPFIMSITPDIHELYEKSERITKLLNDPKTHNMDMVKAWADINQWYLEIDTRVLTKGDRLCVDDGAQFVALLCHEIGHVMMENPLRLFYNYKLKSLNFSTMEKLMLSNSRIVRSILLPMYTHTLQFMIVVADRNDAKKCEIAADMYVPDAYKGALVSYMNDHILPNPDSSKLVMDESTFDKEQNLGIELSKESIEMLKGRRDLLNKQIQNQYNDPDNGTFQKKLMMFIGKNMTGYNPDDDKYITGLKTMMEHTYQREYENASKAAESMLMEAARISSRDLDILEVQAEDIHTPEDKMYMIHKIYDYIEAIDAETIKKSKKLQDIPGKIKDDRLDRLNSIRTKVLATKVSDTGDKYGIFVKYPEGYEG